ncbi:class I SAM-dependent methyltransferase [Streptomyces sp. NPDC059009]|uniref:class I SAM-dependent methyltransferase n=1 Tax=Streptomyces sp. NPDC059009 TaxID=3346694 RepID=UPI0036B3F6DE
MLTEELSATVNSQQAQVWNGPVGTHWADHQGRYDTMLSGVNDALFHAAAVRVGDRVLDIGCGAGATTRIAARLAAHRHGLGPGQARGHAVGVDISAPLLERARASTAAEGITNATYELADAQTHPFPEAGYDVALSRGGVMFFADHAAAFANIARALRPGGRLAFVCPRPADGESEESQALGLFARLLAESGAGGGDDHGNAPVTPSPSAVAAHTAMASLSDPARIHEVLDGYREVTVTPVPVETVWGQSPADTVEFMLSRTPGRAVPAATRAALEEAFAPYATVRGVRMQAGVWLVTAVRP